MTTRFTNVPAPEELLLAARESLKGVLGDPEGDHAYTILMAMNAMGIAARALRAEAPPPADPDTSDAELRRWTRAAPEAELVNAKLIARLRRHVEGKLAISNPRFEPEQSKEPNEQS